MTNARNGRAGGGAHATRTAARSVVQNGERFRSADARQRRSGGGAEGGRPARSPPFAPIQRFFQRLDALGVAERAERLDRAELRRGQRTTMIHVAQEVD